MEAHQNKACNAAPPRRAFPRIPWATGPAAQGRVASKRGRRGSITSAASGRLARRPRAAARPPCRRPRARCRGPRRSGRWATRRTAPLQQGGTGGRDGGRRGGHTQLGRGRGGPLLVPVSTHGTRASSFSRRRPGCGAAPPGRASLVKASRLMPPRLRVGTSTGRLVSCVLPLPSCAGGGGGGGARVGTGYDGATRAGVAHAPRHCQRSREEEEQRARCGRLR